MPTESESERPEWSLRPAHDWYINSRIQQVLQNVQIEIEQPTWHHFTGSAVRASAGTHDFTNSMRRAGEAYRNSVEAVDGSVDEREFANGDRVRLDERLCSTLPRYGTIERVLRSPRGVYVVRFANGSSERLAERDLTRAPHMPLPTNQ